MEVPAPQSELSWQVIQLGRKVLKVSGEVFTFLRTIKELGAKMNEWSVKFMQHFLRDFAARPPSLSCIAMATASPTPEPRFKF